MKKPGLLELPVLGLLKDRAMHGYELRKQLSAMLGPLWQVSWGSLYPTLRRLARAGAVQASYERRPRKGSSSRDVIGAGRRRTVYRITPKGEELFRAMLEETAEKIDTDSFTLRLAFFRYLRPETRVALLKRRRAYLQEKLAQFKVNLRTYRERIDGYALSLQNHDMATTESDIAWIDELITSETQRARSRPASGGPSAKSKVRQDA
jgi:DNA-binding PadR family transcriptional regulator